MADIDELFACFDESTDTSGKKSASEHAKDGDKVLDAEAKGNKRIHDNDDLWSKRTKLVDDDAEQNINIEEFAHRIQVQSIDCLESCTHEVAFPPEQTYTPLKPFDGEPAKIYTFTLDGFQKESILCIDNDESVLVSAHTSAGKTVVAEYAIAKSLKQKQRVIYTTPIKALSNQKYREFMDEFKDVGLVTGDVTINPTASCLVMTTEILRNMLYRGSEIMREVGWVIFDEIHYMRDKERGVVWEETLILLPHNVHYVFLSATIPNARQFAEWVTHIHQQPCHVVYTDYRPTPLQHYVFPAGGQGINLVVDENGMFKDENFNAAMGVLQNAGEAAKGDQKGRRGGIRDKDPTQTDIYKLIKMIMDRDLAPVIVFSFSKKDCELYATQMTKFDFNSKEEKNLVDEVFQNALEVLNEVDRHLPQVESLLPFLRRGIGIHHGGLLPILKETIEILFGEGLIKVLFATETFAMGLNMPARTVLFTGCRKFDGKEFRQITSGEYIQMSGRAGRRGLDDKGTVILMIDEKVPPATCREIVKGSPDPINSAFHLTYNMVLNLLRVEEINPEYMLERSFFQYQNQNAIPQLYDGYQKAVEECGKIVLENEESVAGYYNIREELNSFEQQFRSYLGQPRYLLPFCKNGRLVKIRNQDDEYDWGAIVGFRKVHSNTGRKSGEAKSPKFNYKLQLNVLLYVVPFDSEEPANVLPKPCRAGESGKYEVVTVDSSLISRVSSVRLTCPKDSLNKDAIKAISKTITEVKNRFADGPPLLDPIEDMKIAEEPFVDMVDKMKILQKKMEKHTLHKNPNLNKIYSDYGKKVSFSNQVKEAKQKLQEAKAIIQLDELKCRKRVLRRLGYCTNTDVIQLKGRVACELSSADELLLTEMIFNGIFGPLTPAQACSLLSCFVCDEKSTEVPKLSEELSGPLRQMQDLARRIAKVSTEARLDLEETAYVERFKPFLMDVVFSWCNGSSFSDLCRMTEIFEGSIIRCMRRLEELLRQMVQASKTIGNTELEDKFNTAVKQIKRDIIFASSLYL